MELLYRDFVAVEDYQALRRAVGWEKLTDQQAQQGLTYSTYVVGCYEGEKIAGCMRVLWDRGYIAFFSDIMVMPAYQRRGIGRHMVELALEFMKAQLKEGWKIKVTLAAAKGKEPFYKKLGFEERPNELAGAGMDLWLEK